MATTTFKLVNPYYCTQAEVKNSVLSQVLAGPFGKVWKRGSCTEAGYTVKGKSDPYNPYI